MAEAISLEMGAPIDFSTQLQAGTGASHIKSYIKVLKEYSFEAKLGEHALNNNILHEPKGVCALITPWNWPMNQVCLKVIPAIAAGCTMVLKPSEIAPLSSIILAEMIDEIKLPKGVFNLINGDGAVAGNAVAGGTGKPDGLDKGYFVKPTAFADVNNQMQIARTEIFGPVLSIIPFETEEEAIAIANDTPYGLLNFIQTQDQEKANRVARKLRSGMVDINGAGLAPDAPFGGYKHSGIGREAGKLGLEEYLEVKVVSGWND